MTTTTSLAGETRTVGGLEVTPYLHPQGCRGYLLVDPASKEGLVVDAHLDLVAEAVHAATQAGYDVRWVVDTHTHADHPSGAAALAAQLGATRVAHKKAGHAGVTLMPDDQEPLALGDQHVVVRHAPGHTPDHMVLVTDGALFSGDSLLIGGVARTDFIGGDAGQLFDSLHDIVLAQSDATVLYPGHDYAGQVESTIGVERAGNPWLEIADRDKFVKHLIENPPDEPANMAALLEFNRENHPIPTMISAADTRRIVESGGAGTVIDVRTAEEIEAAHVPGTRHIEMQQIPDRIDDVRKTPAPRLILCRSGQRAGQVVRYLYAQGVGGLSVVDGGILAYAEAGGETKGGGLDAVGDAGGCCAAPPPS